VPDYQIFQIIRRYPYWAKFFFLLLLYLGCTTNSFRYRFNLLDQCHQGPLLCFLSVHNWRSWWSRSQGSGYTIADTCLKASLNMSLKPAVSLIKLFSGKKQNFWSWGPHSSARLLGLLNYRTPDYWSYATYVTGCFNLHQSPWGVLLYISHSQYVLKICISTRDHYSLHVTWFTMGLPCKHVTYNIVIALENAKFAQ
jgi:hypothetical protein